MIKAEIYLKGEFGDKGFNIQFTKISEKQKNKVKALVYSNEDVRFAKPFIQGDQNDWLMIEFWYGDLEHLRNATQIILAELGIEDGKVSCYDLWKLYEPAPEQVAQVILARTKKHAATTMMNSLFSSCKSTMRSAIAEYEANQCGYTLYNPQKKD